MKTRSNFLITAIVTTCSIAFIFSACNKNMADPPPSTSGSLMLHMHTIVGDNEVEDYDSVYVLSDGRKISVSKAQLYLSDIQLIKADGSTYDFSGKIILKNKEIEGYDLGSAPAGNYKSIRFNVGLSPTINASTPTSADTLLNRPDMWFGVSAQPSGFVFVNFQGKIDTTTAANGSVSQMQAFTYKIGSNANLKSVTLPDQAFSIVPTQIQFIHLTIDYSKLFTGVVLNNSSNLNVSTIADNAGALGIQVSNNIASMFAYE